MYICAIFLLIGYLHEPYVKTTFCNLTYECFVIFRIYLHVCQARPLCVSNFLTPYRPPIYFGFVPFIYK